MTSTMPSVDRGFTGLTSNRTNVCTVPYGFTGKNHWMAPPTPILILSLILIVIPPLPARRPARRAIAPSQGGSRRFVAPERNGGGSQPKRYARYGLVRMAVRVRPQKHPMFIGLGTAVRLEHPKCHP